MSKIKTILRGGALAAFLTVIMAAPTFAATCTTGPVADQNPEYSGLHIGSGHADYTVRCAGANIDTGSGAPQPIYGKTSADCAKAASLAANPEGCNAQGLNSTIQLIINMIIFAIGLVAVVMVIMGGVQYSTSQGDSGKVKKAKDTIMYGIIGLVVAILAFAIVNFVLSSIVQG